MPKQYNESGKILAVLLLIGIVLGILICLLVRQGFRIMYPDPRDALPWNTYQEVNIVSNGGLTGDGSYHLKARVSQDGFDRFIKKMGFDKTTYDSRSGRYIITPKAPDWECWAQYTNGMLEFHNASH